MNKLILSYISLAFLLSAFPLYADFDPGVWKWSKPITLPSGSEQEQYVKVNVDLETSFAAKADLGDLRVVSSLGREVPYQLVVENDTVRSEYVNSRLSDLSTNNSETMFILDLGQAGILHDHLMITTDSKNFKRSVTVSSADRPLPLSSTEWRVLTEKGYIYNFFDATTGFNAGSGDVRYPENTSRYLRVVIRSGEGSDVHVVGANILRLTERSGVEQRYPIPAMIRQNLEQKTTEIVVDMGGEGLPTHRITLETKEKKNFSRRAIVHASKDGESWVGVGEGYVFSLNTPLFGGQQLVLPYREVSNRFIRVLIVNEDDTPISWEENATIDGVVRSLIFAASEGETYSLYYGNTKAFPPRYDLVRYVQFIESTSFKQAFLGAAIPNSAYIPPAPPIIPYSEQHDTLLNAVLVLLAAVVAFLTIAYLKKLKLSDRVPK